MEPALLVDKMVLPWLFMETNFSVVWRIEDRLFNFDDDFIYKFSVFGAKVKKKNLH